MKASLIACLMLLAGAFAALLHGTAPAEGRERTDGADDEMAVW